jgi:hypothetical protein
MSYSFEFQIDTATRSYLWRQLGSSEAIRFQTMKSSDHPSQAWNWLMLQGLFLNEETPISLDFLDREMLSGEYRAIQEMLAENIMAISIADGQLVAKSGYEELLSGGIEISCKTLYAGTFAQIQDAIVSKNPVGLGKVLQSAYGVAVADLNFWECSALLNDLSNQLAGDSQAPKVTKYIPPTGKK